MSEPILTENAINYNIVTNLDNSVTTVTIEDPSSAEVANPPLARARYSFRFRFMLLQGQFPLRCHRPYRRRLRQTALNMAEPLPMSSCLTRFSRLA